MNANVDDAMNDQSIPPNPKVAVRLVFVLALVALLVAPTQAQEVSSPAGLTLAPPLITQPIDNTQLVQLRGNTPPEANERNDRGPLADAFPIEHMFLLLRRSPEQEEALERFIGQLNDPTSQSFHQWLTAKEFGEQYGLAKEDLDTIHGWLGSKGFVVNLMYPNGILINFSGTAGQVRQAFHTGIHHLMVNGEWHFANMSDPQIPAALAPAVLGVVSLNNFRPQPMTRKVSPNDASGQSCGLGGTCYGVVPADIATIYNINPLFFSGVSGQGQTIVVVEDSDVYNPGDWTTFRSTFGLAAYTSGSLTTIHPSTPPQTNCIDPGVGPPQSEQEAIADAEWASAAAPGAAIVIASCADGSNSVTGGWFLALENLVTGPGTPPAIISMSYGQSEDKLGAVANAAVSLAYQQAVAEGVSIFVASGGASAANNDQGQSYATYGFNLNGFASTPYNVAVGGTDFSDTASGVNNLYWGSTNPSTYGSALSYIPEIPWNDSCASGVIDEFEGYNSGPYGVGSFCNSGSAGQYLNVVGGGGGPSGCATGSSPLAVGGGSVGVVGGGCAGYAKPTWQSILGNPNDGVRDVPDVSLFAGDGVWGHSYTLCYSDTSNGGSLCTGNPSTWSHEGGTSIAAPIMAGIQALINQKTGTPWGNPNPFYYSIAATEYGMSGSASCASTVTNSISSSCVFYDVTLGDTAVPCIGENCYLPSGTYGVLSVAPQTLTVAYVTALGTGYTSPPACSLTGGGGSGAACASSITPVVSSLNLSNGGAGYSVNSPPTCTLSGGGGSGATCLASVSSSGAVSQVSLLAFGSGYTSVPTCTLSGGGGSGAICSASISTGLAVTLTNGGSGYTSLPNCSLTGGGGFGATCTALANNSAASYEPAYEAGLGWDFATGLGTVNAANLVAQWPASEVTTGTVTSLTSSSAVLNGTINPAGSPGNAYFYWGTDPILIAHGSYGSISVTANSTPQSFSAPVGTLQTNTTYYFQIVFENTAKGTYQFGSILSFTTLQTTTTTAAASPVTSSSAVLNGAINPGGSPGNAYFYWGTDPTMTAHNTYGPISVTANSTTQSFSAPIGPLPTNTTYYFQMVFENTGNGTYQFGSILSLTTLQTATTTAAATSVTSSSAVLNGAINPAGSPGNAYLYWGTDPTMSTHNSPQVGSVTANSTTQSFSAPLGTLQTNTTYYFQMVFYNSGNSTYQFGSILSFTTLQTTTTTAAATSVTSSGAVLNGSINPGGSPGNAFFYWGTDPTMTAHNTYGPVSVIANSTTQSFSASFGSLQLNTTYYFQMVFYNSGNSTYQFGSILSFTTQQTTTTAAATSVTSSSAVLNGSINPGGSSGVAYFYWGTDPTLSAHASYGPISVTTNSTAQSFSASIGPLQSNTSYYFQMVFYNSGNSTYQLGSILSFTTLQTTTTTAAANPVTSSSAVLNGAINPGGSPGNAFFYWGTDPTMTAHNTYGPVSVTVNSTTQSFSASIGPLQSNTTYYFQMVFYNSGNSTYQLGSILSFTTLQTTTTTAAANPVTSSSAVLNGAINPGGSAGNASFYWGTDPTLSAHSTYGPVSVTVNSSTQSFSASIGPLQSNTTYYFQMVFYNSGNSTYQLASPQLHDARDHDDRSGNLGHQQKRVLNGHINPGGSPGNAFFYWGTDPTMTAHSTYGPVSVTVNSTTQSFSASIGPLQSNTTYYFQMVFYNSGNSTYQFGSIFSFTTQQTTTTAAATSVTSSSAVLNGSINPGGLSGVAYFYWGTDPTLSAHASYGPISITANSTTQSFSAPIGVLLTNTTYYFQMVFENTGNSTYQLGSILSFTTLPTRRRPQRRTRLPAAVRY